VIASLSKFNKQLLRLLFFVFCTSAGFLSAYADASGEDTLRIWTDARGRTLSGRLLAYDRVRATIELDGERIVFLSPGMLSQKDRQFLNHWRTADPAAPWIDPANLPPWPKVTGTGKVEVAMVENAPEADRFVYHSPNFEIVADVQLPLGTISEMATAFEATRATLLSLPLGLAAKPEITFKSGRGSKGIAHPEATHPGSSRLRVELFITPQKYALAGGPGGSGGYYSMWHRSTLISLENFGIQLKDGRLALDYGGQLFIIRHEICHQVLHDWLPVLPVWLNEGLSEYVASIPYLNGHYRFGDTKRAFIDYLNKWRYNEAPDKIPMRASSEMFEMSGEKWKAAIAIGPPIINYNSAALLTWYFIHQDDQANAAHLAAYFRALLDQPHRARQAFARHLLRDRNPTQIDSEIRAAWKLQGIEITSEWE